MRNAFRRSLHIRRTFLLTLAMTGLALLCSACGMQDNQRGREESVPAGEESRYEPSVPTPDPEETIDPYEEEKKLAAEMEKFLSSQEEEEESLPDAPEKIDEAASEAAAPSSEPGETEPVSSLEGERVNRDVQPKQEASLPSSYAVEEAQVPEMEQYAAGAAQSVRVLEDEEVEQLVLALINGDRQAQGREALGMQEDMRLAARIRAGEVLVNLSHTRPDGTAYNTAFDEAGFSYAGKYHGENILYLQSPAERFTSQTLAQRIFDELKSSPGHYGNMMQENYVQAGIGLHIRYHGENMEVGCAQLFAGI